MDEDLCPGNGPSLLEQLSDAMIAHHVCILHNQHVQENDKMFLDKLKMQELLQKRRMPTDHLVFDHIVDNETRNPLFCNRDVVLYHGGNAAPSQPIPDLGMRYETQHKYIPQSCTRTPETHRHHHAFLNNTKNRVIKKTACFDVPIDQEKEYRNAAQTDAAKRDAINNYLQRSSDLNYWRSMADAARAQSCKDNAILNPK